MLHPSWFAFLPHVFYPALSLQRALLSAILFLFVKLHTFNFFHHLLRSLSFYFSSFQDTSFFPICHYLQYNTYPDRISFVLIILCLSLILPQTLHSCFCLSKLCFFLLHGGRSGKAGWIFLLWTNTQECSSQYLETLQRRACMSPSTLSVNGSLTNAWKSAAYFNVVL